ncbi:hypothetical protein AB0331_15695 [Dietzia maris]|uniref:hypothetical protein n=1 Tax=Dietzia maris TaxID=37915 RepID=UPI00344D9DC8
MDTRTATTVRTKTDAAHTLLFPLAEAVSTAMSELDDAIGLTTDAVDAAESHAEDLDLMADTAADLVALRTACARLESLEELRSQLEQLHSAVDQAHTYAEEAGGIHEASIDALNAITSQ